MELAAFDGEFIESRMFFRECLGIIPVDAFMTLRFQRLHGQGLSRAGIDAGTAAVAVERRNLDAEFIVFQALADGFLGLEVSRSLGFFVSRYQIRTDSGVRADQGAAVTLDAFFQVPFRNGRCDAAFFIFRRAQGVGTVGIGDEFTDRDGITELQVSRFDDFLDEFRNIAGIFDDGVRRQVFPCFRYSDFDDIRNAAVDGSLVHGDDLFAFGQIGLGNGVFHVFHGIVDGQDVGQFEESCLQDRIGAVAAQADFFGDLGGIDDIEADVLGSELAFYFIAEVVGDVVFIPAAVEQEDAAVLDFTDNIVSPHVCLFMAGQEVRRFDIVRSPDRILAKAQVRLGDAAGFLGIVFKVSLDIHIRVVADDLDGVLVGTNRAVRAKAPELAADGPFRVDRDRYVGQGMMGNIVDDAQGEVVLRLKRIHVGEDGVDRCRRYVFRRQAIAAGQDGDVLFDVGHGCADIFVERFAQGARFFRAVHDGNRADRVRHGFHKVFQRERTIEVDLDEADFLAFFAELVDSFLDGTGDRTHGDDDVFCVRSAVVIEEVVRTARQFADLVHVVLDNVGQALIPGVIGFAGLEEHIRVGNGTAHNRMFRVQAGVFEMIESIAVDEFAQFFSRQHLDFLDFVGCAEAVKEVHERNAAFDGRQMGNGCQVGTFLDAGTAEHSPARVATAHDVGMVAKDGHGVSPNGTGGNVQDDRFQFARQAVHDRNHQHQALRRRKGRTEAARFRSAVDGTDSAGFGLHFN